ncbi:MAG: hypothetical protein J1E83_14015 [Lachnospiraceae bacterium]|nr:hypothetical protein [Lachnospiraceae bacterium]
MTESEKLDLLLEKVTGLEKDMIDVKADLHLLLKIDKFSKFCYNGQKECDDHVSNFNPFI